MEGLTFGGAYLQREICVSKSNGLAFYLGVNLPFLLCFTLYLRAIFQVQAPGGLIFGGAYFRNFTVGYAQFLRATDVYLPGKCASVEFPRKRTLNSVLFLPVETCRLNTAQ